MKIVNISILVAIAFVSLNFPSVQAALRLSVNPVEGGNSLRFGRNDGVMQSNKAVRLRVSSDEGRQYQVYQRLQDPLVNQDNNSLGEGVLSTYTVSGSNASGTLYAQSNELLGPADQLIFTSSQDGQSDTITVNYMINPDRIRSSGDFVGRIAYAARALGGGQDEAIINVYLEASGAFKVSVEGARHPGRVFIRSSKYEASEDGIKIEFQGNAGKEIKIYQELESLLQNEQGKELPNDTLQFVVTSDGPCNFSPSPDVLGRKRQLIYRCGESDGKVDLRLSLNALADEAPKAGTYRGRMRLSVESSSGLQDFPLDIEVQIDPVFDIEVVLPPQGVRFNRILPFDPPQTHEVFVKVKSNLGKPYVVMQNVATPLVDSDGDQIKEEYFSVKTELTSKSAGKVAAAEFVPVGIGEKAVFYSDAKGTPSEFKVIYRLQSYADIRAGEYGAPIVFSLGEM